MAKDRFKVRAAVYLILFHEGKVLLLRRHNTGYRDGYYSFPAGHIDGNERLVDAMQREAKEELGIEVTTDNLRLLHVMHRMLPDHERVNFFFTTDSWIGEPKNLESHKCDDLRWFDLKSLPDNIIPYIKQAIEYTQSNIVYSDEGFPSQ